MSVEIRELAISDEVALCDLMDAVVPEWRDLAGLPASGPRAFLADDDSFVVGAYLSAEPVGWAWAVRIRYPNGRRVAYLHQLDVVEGHRRRGVGTMLVEAAIECARRLGCSKFWLSTGGHNDAAQALYDRLGGDRKPDGDVNYWWEL